MTDPLTLQLSRKKAISKEKASGQAGNLGQNARPWRVMRMFRFFTFAIVGCVAVGAPLVAHFGFGIGFSTVLSESMRPTFSAGDLQVTQLVPASGVTAGDIVLLNSPELGGVYSHRVVTVERSASTITLTTRGDANPASDQNSVLLPTASKISEVVTTVPFVGRVILFLTSPAGRWFGPALVVFAALLAFVRFLIRKSIKTDKKELLI